MVEDSIRSFALDEADIVAEIGARFYIDHVPDNADLPFVKLSLVDDDQLYSHDGESGHIPLYQMEVYAEAKSECNALSVLLFARFVGHSGVMGDVTVGYIFPRIVRGEFAPDSRNYRRILELRIGTNDR